MGKRITTALVLIPFVIAAVWFLPAQWFALVFAFIALLAAWEWGALLGFHIAGKISYCFLVAFVFFLGYYLLPPFSNSLLLHVGLIWWGLAGISLLFNLRASWWWFISGVFSLLIGWYALVWLRGTEQGPALLLALLCLVWIADSAAYFSGRLFGRHKLAPRLSPGKTVEGLLGGVVSGAVFVVITAWGWLQIPNAQLLALGGFSALIVLISVVGDLFESQFKRNAGVKDSGNWLPGHGGILDRIDSMLAAAPVFGVGVLTFYQHA